MTDTLNDQQLAFLNYMIEHRTRTKKQIYEDLREVFAEKTLYEFKLEACMTRIENAELGFFWIDGDEIGLCDW